MSGIANFGSFAGGLMRGHLAATEEQRREEDQAFQKEQRGQTREEWERAAGIRRGIAALPQVGSQQTRRVLADYGKADNDYQDQFRDEQYAYTPEMRQQALAGLYRQFGREDLAGGAEDRGFILGQRGREQEALDWYRGQLADFDKNRTSYVQRVLAEYNDDGIGGEGHAGVRASVSPDNKYIAVAGGGAGGAPMYIPIDQAVRQLLNDELMSRMAGISAASAQQYANYGVQRGQLDVQRGQLGVAQRNAATNESYRDGLLSRPLVQSERGQIFVMDPRSGALLATHGSRMPDPGAGAASRPNIRTAMISVPDQATGKPTKVPVNVVTQLGPNNVPVVRAYTMNGQEIKDNKLLTQLAGGEPGREGNPISLAMRDSIINNKEMTPQEKFAQLRELDKIDATQALLPQISNLPQEERVPELRKIMGLGLYKPDELMRTFGFTAREVKEASSPPKVGIPSKPNASTQPEDTTRYIREKSPRGGYIYTPSPRGQTKAEFAEIDRQNGK